MKRTLLIGLVGCLALTSSAQDSWTGKDKQQHVAVSAALGFAASQYTNDKWAAFGLAMAPGIAKEIWDSKRANHTASLKDLTANALGAYLGMQFGNKCLITSRSFSCTFTF